MTVVDSSAIVAIIRAEADAKTYSDAIERVARPVMSAGTLLELGIVFLHREGPLLVDDLYELLESAGIEVVPVTQEQARLAIDAYRRFGKSSGHPARLNYGDCFSYALAKARNEPLLYKGDDFAETDVAPAL